jgi:hypothetical protein
MTCISRIPQCGDRTATGVTPEPISNFGSILGTAFGIAGGISTFLGAVDKLPAVIGFLGVAGAGAVSGAIGGAAVIILVIMYANDRCVTGKGLQECVAGVVNSIVESFSDGFQNLFPFTAMHDRAEIVVKSRFWDILESSGAFVQCTDAPTPQRSEIMRCYFFSADVCAAETGAVVGSVIGAVGGVIAAAAIAAAIGCATIVLCIFALILAFVVAVVAALVGALIAGQIGRATAADSHPADDSGTSLMTGDLVSVNGQRSRRQYDDGAWVMWFARSITMHGHVTDGITSNPFSYCDIDDELPADSCPLPQAPIA